MQEVVLLGDSIFDNYPYVEPGQAVPEHLRRILPDGYAVNLLAVDGSVTEDVIRQAENIPGDAAHLFVSSGGNDALGARYRLFEQTFERKTERFLPGLTDCVLEFQHTYHELLNRLRTLEIPATVCTVYSSVPGLTDTEKVILSTFNDVIVQEAVTARFSIIDLRRVCTEPDDYATVSPIEPSETGGRKIAEAIAAVLREHVSRGTRVVIYP
jgi:lysophospholipase L1-like esterase